MSLFDFYDRYISVAFRVTARRPFPVCFSFPVIARSHFLSVLLFGDYPRGCFFSFALSFLVGFIRSGKQLVASVLAFEVAIPKLDFMLRT